MERYFNISELIQCIFSKMSSIFDGQTPYPVQFSQEIMETSYVSWVSPLFFRAPPQPGPRTFGSYRPTWTAPAWPSSRGDLAQPIFLGKAVELRGDRIPPKKCAKKHVRFHVLKQNLVPSGKLT